MSQHDPAPSGDTTPPTTGPANQPPPPAGTAPGQSTTEHRAPDGIAPRPTSKDALRGSRTSHLWVALLLMVVVLVLLAVFVLQNTQDVEVSYFGATGQSPLAAALLIAFAAGLLVAGVAGTLRIWQLRRRVRKLDR